MLKQSESHSHLVPRLAACHRSYRHWRCERNHNWVEAENSCSLRICPHCCRRRSLILAGRIEAFLGERLLGLRYLVLSMQNVANLEEGMDLLWAAWTRLRRSKRWKLKVKGCIVAMEVTRNAEDGSWHPHLNVLFEGEYFPVQELRLAWIKATGGEGQQVWISQADRHTVRELIKYVTKLSDLLIDPESLDTFLDAIKGARLLRTYGTFFGLKIDDEENPEELGRCPDCGPEVYVRVEKLGSVEPHDLHLDCRGVFRISKHVKPKPLCGVPFPRKAISSAQRALDRLFAPIVRQQREQNREAWKEYQGATN